MSEENHPNFNIAQFTTLIMAGYLDCLRGGADSLKLSNPIDCEKVRRFIEEMEADVDKAVDMKKAQDDIRFLIQLVPEWARDVKEGLDPTMYGTCTYEGDLKIKQVVDRIVDRYCSKKKTEPT